MVFSQLSTATQQCHVRTDCFCHPTKLSPVVAEINSADALAPLIAQSLIRRISDVSLKDDRHPAHFLV
jgi:hypothetical protein